MGLIEIVVTVCATANAGACREEHLQFADIGSTTQCAMMAPPYIAKWVDEHPKWTAVRWRCDYPGRSRAI
jgi:hypothetical protein